MTREGIKTIVGTISNQERRSAPAFIAWTTIASTSRTIPAATLSQLP